MNLDKQEKSKGVLLFAYNTPTVDYVKIAERAAQLIKHQLKLPTTIITAADELKINFRTGGEYWFNGDRYRAYDLSPYDETLLLDSDYLVLDDSLLKVLDTVADYAIVTNNQTPTQTMNGEMGMLSLDYVWATAIAFKKTPKVKLLFDLVGRIQRNYGYYRKLYNLRYRDFRNDYAFTIADNILNGYIQGSGIPWPMLTIYDTIQTIEPQGENLIVREQNRAWVMPYQNIHIMDKKYLQSDAHAKFVEIVCQN